MYNRNRLVVAFLSVYALFPQTLFAQMAATEPSELYELPRVDVIGHPDNLDNIPGSGNILNRADIETSRVFTGAEALRKIPGVHVRDEEGIGLRPNIGLRGLNPTRSTKTTLLEDGVPLSYAPYGDNATFYSPAVDRYDRIEVLKGAGQTLFGPQTIGGVVNYITAIPSKEFKGRAQLVGGNRDFFDANLRLSGGGLLFDYIHRQSDGARDNTHTELHDLNIKGLFQINAAQAITARASYYTEDSNVSYTGITDSEFNNLGPRYNPFKYDNFKIERYATSMTHDFQISDRASLITNAYFQWFNRDFWRQLSATNDNPCAGYVGVTGNFQADRNNGIAVDIDRCRSMQGRLRQYKFFGIEPRLELAYSAFGIENKLDAGVKLHLEDQDRIQRNGTEPGIQNGATLVEDSDRTTKAYSFFAQNHFTISKWSITPGVRYEGIENEFKNNLLGQQVDDKIGEWIPSLGVTFNPTQNYTIFAGAHKGFAPPRVEDIINGTTGTSTNVDAEKSTNYEFGIRATLVAGVNIQATLFRNDYTRLISVGRIANGSVPLSQGEALYQGVELGGNVDLTSGLYFRFAVTYLPTAEQTTPFTQVVNGAVVSGSEAGKRQPYAPERQATISLGYGRGGFTGQVEAVHVGEQFADFANTEVPVTNGNGQIGKIGAYTIYNLALNYKFRGPPLSLFFTAKNLADKVYIVDRTRGIQVGSPRLIQAGVRYEF
jgi:Fe(3+) dicitrate transport protein